MCLLGIQVKVNSNAGIFVTLNPAGKEYKGRSALPANLKALFRPVAMTRPDNTCIVEATLLAEGFSDGKVLSKKIVLAFGSLSRLLSMQSHYDWSLRALKAVLQTACKIFSSRVRDSDDTPTTDEVSSTLH